MAQLKCLVVGGGPVGSALALFLSRADYQVTLVDGGAAEQKICGEGLLPAAWDVLQELEIARSLGRRGPIRGISYSLAGKSVQADLTKPAFGVERPQLMQGFYQALNDSKVELLKESKFRDFRFREDGRLAVEIAGPSGEKTLLDCDFLIGADGLHSTVRRKAGLESAKARRYARWGSRLYFESKEQRDRVEVTLGDGLESYLTPLGQGLYGLAFLWTPESLGRPLPGEGKVWERLMQMMGPEMRERLPSLQGEPWGEDRAIGPLQQRVSSVLHPSGRIALVGDAAGYLDALTGEGLCLGLRQARSLARCLIESRVADYPKEHRAIKFRHSITVSALLWLVHRQKLRRRVFEALYQAPEQFQAMLRFAVEEAPISSLLTPQTPNFLKSLCRL